MGFGDAIGTAVSLGVRLATKPDFPSAPSIKFDLYDEIDKAMKQYAEYSSPELKDAQKSLAGSAKSLAAGQLPPDIEALIKRTSAEFGAQSGLGITQVGARTARDLGRTSLDLKSQAAALAQAVQAMELNQWNTAQNSALHKAEILFKKKSMALDHAYAQFASQETRSREYAASAGTFSSELIKSIQAMTAPGDTTTGGQGTTQFVSAPGLG